MSGTKITFDLYKQNLHAVFQERDGQDRWLVYSYSRLVAVQDPEDGTLRELGYWSMTTRKHVNYAGKELRLRVVHAHR